jgi:hypothetical protein
MNRHRAGAGVSELDGYLFVVGKVHFGSSEIFCKKQFLKKINGRKTEASKSKGLVSEN